MSFYTRNGDDGTTGLLGKGRVKKYENRMEALGCLDEASAALGLSRAFVCSVEIKEIVLKMQKLLYLVMGEVAADEENRERFSVIKQEHITEVEELIDQLSKKTKIPSEFIVPGDTKGGAFLGFARTVTRRAERRLVEMFDTGLVRNQSLIKFLNRLSSLLFILEIYENSVVGETGQTLVK